MATQTFSVTGTWTCPAGIRWVLAECWGGGGAGGGATGSPSGGGGGAGGAYARKLVPVVAGTIYTVTAGVAVTGGEGSGSQGNPSWFSSTSTVFAEGGLGGGLASSNNTSAAGATASSAASIGDRVQKGGDGGTGSVGASGGGGGEGAGQWANGTNGGVTSGGTGTDGGDGGAAGITTGNGGPGSPGTSPGGGGGGGRAGSATNRSAGDGAAGQVILTWNFQQLNNYLGLSVGSGESTVDKIR